MKKDIPEKICKCLIIAAGNGSRLAPEYSTKPLAQLLGLPLIERVIMIAKQAGLRDFYVTTGYHAKEVQDFLEPLAKRRGIRITPIFNADWKLGNGNSVLKAKKYLKDDRFVLMMADHIADPEIIRTLKGQSISEDEICLAIDPTTSNPLVDLDDVTRVHVANGKVLQIGKSIKESNAFDTGFFLCSPTIFSALEESVKKFDDFSLSGGVGVLAKRGKVRTHSVAGKMWIDVDDPKAMRLAEKTILSNLKKENDGPISIYLNRPISVRLSRYLVRTSFTPNQISFFSFLMSVVGAFIFALEGYFALAIGALLVQFASIIDGCDGEVARLKFQSSDYGGWFDAVLDRYADAFMLFGLTWHVHAGNQSGGIWLIGFLAIIGSFMNSYTADKYDGLMASRIGHDRQIRIGRDVRVFVVFLGAILNFPLVSLILIASVANVESIRRLIVCRKSTSKFDLIRRTMEAVISRSSVPEDPIHSKNTLKWLLKLRPNANEALKIAALGHDIDRAVETKVRREEFEDYDEFKAAHAQHSARMIQDMMDEIGYEKELIQEVGQIVCHHEVGGDPNSDLIKDVDSISFFDVNLPLYFKRNTWEESKRRCVWGIKRLSDKMREEVKKINFENKELQQLVKMAFEEASQSHSSAIAKSTTSV